MVALVVVLIAVLIALMARGGGDQGEAVPTEAAQAMATATSVPAVVILATETATPTETAEATPTPTPVGDIGVCALVGTVRAQDAETLIPLTGVRVSFEQRSMVRTGNSGETVTNDDGSFSFPSILIHDTDTIVVYAELEGYTPQQAVQGGFDLWSNCYVDLVLISEAQPTVSAT